MIMMFAWSNLPGNICVICVICGKTKKDPR